MGIDSPMFPEKINNDSNVFKIKLSFLEKLL